LHHRKKVEGGKLDVNNLLFKPLISALPVESKAVQGSRLQDPAEFDEKKRGPAGERGVGVKKKKRGRDARELVGGLRAKSHAEERVLACARRKKDRTSLGYGAFRKEGDGEGGSIDRIFRREKGTYRGGRKGSCKLEKEQGEKRGEGKSSAQGGIHGRSQTSVSQAVGRNKQRRLPEGNLKEKGLRGGDKTVKALGDFQDLKGESYKGEGLIYDKRRISSLTKKFR